MTIEVIGAGFGRTGTLSLMRALERLDFAPCYHMFDVYEDDHVQRWLRGDLGVLDGYRATVDWPACTFWRELMVRYPDAKVVLSVRDPDDWKRSFDATVGEVIRRAHRPSTRAWVAELRRFVIEVVEQRSFTNADPIVDYRAHNAAVIAGVPRSRLLVFNVRQGWEPLCAFLGRAVPDESFPAVNDRDEFVRLHGQHLRDREDLAELFREARTRTRTC